MIWSCDWPTRLKPYATVVIIASVITTAALISFRTRYTALPPVEGTVDAAWQLISVNGYLRRLMPAPATCFIEGKPPRHYHEITHRYIWVVDNTGIPYIFEKKMETLGNREPKHTNLTAGGQAYIGGELWFRNHRSIYLSGGSGRYPARTAQHLADAVKVFEGYGYEVHSLGWNREMNKAKRTL